MPSSFVPPRVSIGVPVYNGESYLEEALDSLLNQTYQDFEILISDNASTDRTQEICESYVAKDSRIRYERQKTNRGAAANYNRTFKMAQGELFKWAAHDDKCLPTFLERCVEEFDKEGNETVLVYTTAATIDAAGKKILPDPYLKGDLLQPRSKFAMFRLMHTLRTMSMVNAVFGVIRREALVQTRLIDTFIASDYVLMTELAILGRFKKVEEQLLLRRQHPEASRMEANPTLAHVDAWFKGNGRSHKKFFFPKLKLTTEYLRSTVSAKCPVPTKLACAAVVLPAMAERKLRVTAGKWRRRIFNVSHT